MLKPCSVPAPCMRRWADTAQTYELGVAKRVVDVVLHVQQETRRSMENRPVFCRSYEHVASAHDHSLSEAIFQRSANRPHISLVRFSQSRGGSPPGVKA